MGLICSESDIIPIYMPVHSSHLLQPLDVSCFSPLKRAYGRLVDHADERPHAAVIVMF